MAVQWGPLLPYNKKVVGLILGFTSDASERIQQTLRA